MYSTEQRLMKIRNELKAQKVATELAYSAMLMPENAPTATYTGSIDLTTIQEPMARVAVTFTRTDNIENTPYADIAVSTDIDTFEEWVRSIGGTVSGRDTDWGESGLFMIYVNDTTDRSVTFYIDVSSKIVQGQANQTANFTLNISVISPTPGQLTVIRLL